MAPSERTHAASVLLVGAMLSGVCGSPPPITNIPALDYAAFTAQVEPELLGSCGYSNCHGAKDRPMRLYSPAGNRVRKGLPAQDGLTEEEHRANFDRVRSYAATTSADLPDLLRKPLQLEAGGAGHTGVDRFGKNVYGSKDDPRWRLLEAWVQGRLLPPDAGMPVDDGGPPLDADGGIDGGPTCQQQLPYGFAATVGQIVNTATCSDSACHTQANIAAGDAGCFDPTSCQSILLSGCNGSRTVRPCNPFASKLYRYTGVAPFYKSHQGKLVPQHAAVIGAWIDAGAPCD
jgi:hypothetical protein